MTVYTYGLCMSAGILFSALLTYALAYKRKLQSYVPGCVFAALAFGIVFARLGWCFTKYTQYLMDDPASILYVHDGGLSMVAGLIGAYAGVLIYAKLSKLRSTVLCDLLTPGALALIAILRAAETFTGQGIGREVILEKLWHTVLTVEDSWDISRFAVFRYEAWLAILLWAAAVIMWFTSRRPGSVCVRCMCTFAAFQMVFENLRDDDYLYVYYVRIGEALAVCILLGVLIYSLIGGFKRHVPRSVIALVMFAAGIAIVVKQGFAVDGLIHLELDFAIMTLGALMCLAAVLTAYSTCESAAVGVIEHGKSRVIISCVLLMLLVIAVPLFISSGGNAASLTEKGRIILSFHK